MSLERFNYIKQFTGVKPDIEEMNRVKQHGAEEASAEELFLETAKKELLDGNIADVQRIESEFGIPFTLPEDELQMVYAKMLVQSSDTNPEVVSFLLSRTHIAPAPEVLMAHYGSQHFTPSENEILLMNALESTGVVPSDILAEAKQQLVKMTFSDFFDRGTPETFKDRVNLLGVDLHDEETKNILRSAYIFSNIQVEGLEIDYSVADDEYETLFSLAQEHISEWQDEETIAQPFQAGVETFGYTRMLKYIQSKDVVLHDCVYAFRDIVELQKVSGLGEAAFFENVLQQVRRDNRTYSEGTAYHHLNAIAQTTNKSVTEVIAKAQEYKEVARLQELAVTFETPQAVFASWANLKRYSALEQLLGQTDALDELKELKAEGKEALYHYIETLAFHPDSKVDMQMVMQFWRDPESFLAAPASHTSEEVHDNVKPSNYLHVSNLDLTAASSEMLWWKDTWTAFRHSSHLRCGTQSRSKTRLLNHCSM